MRDMENCKEKSWQIRNKIKYKKDGKLIYIWLEEDMHLVLSQIKLCPEPNIFSDILSTPFLPGFIGLRS